MAKHKVAAPHAITTKRHKSDSKAELASTAWRILLPVTVGALAGSLADGHFAGAPWLTLAGIVLGFIGATILVKRQAGYDIQTQHRLEKSHK